MAGLNVRNGWKADTQFPEFEFTLIDEATKFVDIDQLALSPQCGFASTVHGNDITTDQQAEKIRLVIEVAEEVWGRVPADA